jgi:hypothetical protein
MPARRSRNRAQLEHHVVEVIESAERLREALQGYQKQMRKLNALLAKGDPAISAVRVTSMPAGRRPVTKAVDEFEAARHQLRVDLLAAGNEEGISMSEVGRVLGISRQLASRIANEGTPR